MVVKNTILFNYTVQILNYVRRVVTVKESLSDRTGLLNFRRHAMAQGKY